MYMNFLENFSAFFAKCLSYLLDSLNGLRQLTVQCLILNMNLHFEVANSRNGEFFSKSSASFFENASFFRKFEFFST